MSRGNRRIALERVRILMDKAVETHREDPERAQRYADLARRVAQRTRTHLPRDLRRMICPKCNALLVQGSTAHTRIRQTREPHVATTCHRCGHIVRIPLRRKEK